MGINATQPGFVKLNLANSVRQTAMPVPPALLTSTYKAYESYISPDGSWLLQVSPGSRPTYVARSLDSTKAVQWPWYDQTAYSVAWLSDSCRLVEIENRKGQLSVVRIMWLRLLRIVLHGTCPLPHSKASGAKADLVKKCAQSITSRDLPTPERYTSSILAADHERLRRAYCAGKHAENGI